MRMAAAFASVCRPNDVVGLTGTLGAGKTCFVKGLARGLGVPPEANVISPTFVLLREYAGRLSLNHFDAYRLDDSAAMEDIGCGEVFESGGITAIEWADHVAECLPREHFLLAFRVAAESKRELQLTATGPGPASRLDALKSALGDWIV
jgi:tRNA threonylcarbamoyladenosine biosynthesis protein TsaE